MAELHVSKKSISKLFREMQGKNLSYQIFNDHINGISKSVKHYGMTLKILVQMKGTQTLTIFSEQLFLI